MLVRAVGWHPTPPLPPALLILPCATLSCCTEPLSAAGSSMSLTVFFLPVVAELVSPGRQQRPLAHEHQPQEAAQVARQRVEPEQDLAGVLVLRQRVVALGAEA